MAGRQGQIQGMNRALASRLPRTDAASARMRVQGLEHVLESAIRIPGLGTRIGLER